MPCLHEKLTFSSGDYYIFCRQCEGRWIKTSLGRQEYGPCTNGKMIGGDPAACEPAFPGGQFRAVDTAAD